MLRLNPKVVLASAAVYNISGGVAIILFLGALAPVLGFDPGSNMLFRLFVGGTAITFGLAYLHLVLGTVYRTPLLFFGTGLKYWAFVAALVSYLSFGLPASVLVLFGVLNLLFAVLFTVVLIQASAQSDAGEPPAACACLDVASPRSPG